MGLSLDTQITCCFLRLRSKKTPKKIKKEKKKRTNDLVFADDPSSVFVFVLTNLQQSVNHVSETVTTKRA